jgi:hypothetical protein
VNITELVKPDVDLYLRRSIPELTQLGDEQQAALSKLQSRAEGNFLWARLMVKSLSAEANDLDELNAMIESGLPSSSFEHEMYRRLFSRIGADQRMLAW